MLLWRPLTLSYWIERAGSYWEKEKTTLPKANGLCLVEEFIKMKLSERPFRGSAVKRCLLCVWDDHISWVPLSTFIGLTRGEKDSVLTTSS